MLYGIQQGYYQWNISLSEQTMQLFLEAYAAEAGNLALIKNSNFLKIFKQKGRVGSVFNAVPINIILNQQVGLLGSILYGLNH